MLGELTRDALEAWSQAMRRGDFDAAWAISDRLLAARPPGAACWDRPRHEQWVWDGSPLEARRVLVRCYHGLGDTLQFARLLPRLRTIADEVTVWVQPWLIPLLETMGDVGQLLPLHDGDCGVEFDVDIELNELSHALRITPNSLGPGVPYLRVPAAARLTEAFAVGVVAQAGDWDERRSIDPRLLDLRIAGVELFSLQLDSPLPGMRDASESDALRLAARVQSLDLVISVDTMMAHLAGALGVPTWVLLPEPSDWRWMIHRRDSPWYPSMRLFRQPTPGDWPAALRDVRRELHVLASGG